jgi:hypothetical protein
MVNIHIIVTANFISFVCSFHLWNCTYTKSPYANMSFLLFVDNSKKYRTRQGQHYKHNSMRLKPFIDGNIVVRYKYVIKLHQNKGDI